MGDPVNHQLASISGRAAGSLDFGDTEGVLGNNQIEGILSGEGEITIDRDGKFTTINAPGRRDGAITRFLKGLFPSSYRERQRQLDVRDALRDNHSFQRLFRENLKSYALSQMDGDINANRTLCGLRIDELAGKATRAGNTPGKKLDLKALRSCTESLKGISSIMKGVDKEAFDAATKIKCKGQEFNFVPFVKAYARDGRDLDSRQMGGGLMLLASRMFVAFTNIGGPQASMDLGIAAKRIMERACQAGPLGDDGRQALKGDLVKVCTGFASAVSEFAAQALERGYSPTAVANHIADELDFINEGGNMASSGVEFIFTSQSGKLNIDSPWAINRLDVAGKLAN